MPPNEDAHQKNKTDEEVATLSDHVSPIRKVSSYKTGAFLGGAAVDILVLFIV
jgi:hypothetical protein